MAVLKIASGTTASVHIVVGNDANRKNYSVQITGVKNGVDAENVYNVGVLLSACLEGTTSYISMKEGFTLELDG